MRHDLISINREVLTSRINTTVSRHSSIPPISAHRRNKISPLPVRLSGSDLPIWRASREIVSLAWRGLMALRTVESAREPDIIDLQ